MPDIEIGDDVDFVVSGKVVEIYTQFGSTYYRVEIPDFRDEEGLATIPESEVL